MSLINDALKKAQRERSGPAVPPASTPPAPPPGAPPSHHAAPAKGFPWAIVLIALALVGGGAAVWFIKPSTSAPTAVVANAAPTNAAPPAAVEQPPALQINVPNSSALPSPTAAAPAPTPAAPSPAPTVADPAAASAPAPATSSTFKVTLQMEDPRVLAFLDAARINGVRSVADDAKLLMNNKVFRAGAIVDRELGLKLIQILPTELVFEDSHGIQYRKTL
ncbi:MAG: hypothetical protein QM691_00250 [Opitutaceae bacterium]